MYNLDNVTFARQDGEVFRNIYKYGNGQIWWDIDAKNHNVKARYYDGTDGSIATLWDAAALKGDLTIPGTAWTLAQVNDTSSKRLKIGWINSDTAKSIGIIDATDYFQVISIPWNSAYPSQILITASGKQRMYYRTCGNGTWQTPHQLALVDDIVDNAPDFAASDTILAWANAATRNTSRCIKSGAYPSDAPSTSGEWIAEVIITQWRRIVRVTGYNTDTPAIYIRSIYNNAWQSGWAQK